MLQFAPTGMPPPSDSGSNGGVLRVDRPALGRRVKRFRRFSVVAWLALCLILPASAAPPAGTPVAETTTGELYRRLSGRPAGSGPSLTRWSGVTLREALAALEVSLDVPVWLDRRLDPEMLVQLELKWESPWDLVNALAASCGAAAAPLESVILIAPEDQLARMLTGYWELHGVLRSMSSKAEPWRWEGVTEVSVLLGELAARHHLHLADDLSLPHDLWFPRRVPPLTPAAQWSLLLGGFGMQLTREPTRSQRGNSSRGWRIAPLLEAGPLVLSGEGGLPSAERLRVWRARWPEAALRGSPDAWEISASWSALLDLWWSLPDTGVSGSAAQSAGGGAATARRRPATSPRPATDPLANERFTLQYRGSLAALLERLAADLNLTIDPWPLPQPWQQREVQLQSQQLSIDRLLESIGQQVSLEIRRAAPTQVQVTDDR